MTEIILAALLGALAGAFLTWLILSRQRSQQADTFNSLAAQALQANSQGFLQLAQQSMQGFQERAKGDLDQRTQAVEQLVKPIQDSLGKVDEKLAQLEKERLRAYTDLTAQVRGLVQDHLPQLHKETASLVKALRQPAARGRWGEIQLKRVVEMAGMLDHCDFVEQQSETTADGRLRPDMIVRMPGGKQIIIDAKVPLAAYLEANETQDDAAREVLLARHAQQIRTHISQLGRKSYWDSITPTPEFVFMFLPGEAIYSAALQQDPGLIEFGTDESDSGHADHAHRAVEVRSLWLAAGGAGTECCGDLRARQGTIRARQHPG